MNESTSHEREQRNVVITGVSRGIGAQIAQHLAQDPDLNVAGISRSGNGPDEIYSVAGDVTDTASIDNAFSQIEEHQGSTNILVANAGITKDQLMLRMSEDDFAEVLNTNLTGVFRCVKRVLPRMVRERFGRIILMSSVVGLYGSPGQVNYSSAKAALVGMARSLTREVGSRNITANVIAPGFIDTDMTRALPQKTQDKYLDAIPLSKFGDSEQIAKAARFLALDADYISGAVIPVDGGLGMGH